MTLTLHTSRPFSAQPNSSRRLPQPSAQLAPAGLVRFGHEHSHRQAVNLSDALPGTQPKPHVHADGSVCTGHHHDHDHDHQHDHGKKADESDKSFLKGIQGWFQNLFQNVGLLFKWATGQAKPSEQEGAQQEASSAKAHHHAAHTEHSHHAHAEGHVHGPHCNHGHSH
jgi:hypothetical protein